jgi:hypothetical protein
MKMKRMIRFTLSSTLAFLLVAAVVPLSRSQTATQAMLPVPQPGTVLPEVATPCLEPTGKTFEVVGTQSEQSKTFYYLHTWLYAAGDDFESWYSLIQLDSSGCRRLKGVRSGLKPLSSFMTMDTARQLELQRYRREIARAGGKQPFEQRLNQKLSPPAHTAYSGITIYLSQEQVWALQQLSIRFPNTYKLLRPGESVGGGEAR